MGDDQEYFNDEEMDQNAKDDYSKCPTLVNFFFCFSFNFVRLGIKWFTFYIDEFLIIV